MCNVTHVKEMYNFPHLSRPALRPTQPPIQRVPGSFPGKKRPGPTVDNPLPSSADVKQTVQLYLPLLPLCVFVTYSRASFLPLPLPLPLRLPYATHVLFRTSIVCKGHKFPCIATSNVTRR
jgi:hypothetical protein